MSCKLDIDVQIVQRALKRFAVEMMLRHDRRTRIVKKHRVYPGRIATILKSGIRKTCHGDASTMCAARPNDSCDLHSAASSSHDQLSL